MRKYLVLRDFEVSFAELLKFIWTLTSETDSKLLVGRITVTVIKKETSSIISGSREGACETGCCGGSVFQEGRREKSARQ